MKLDSKVQKGGGCILKTYQWLKMSRVYQQIGGNVKLEKGEKEDSILWRIVSREKLHGEEDKQRNTSVLKGMGQCMQ